MEAAQPGDTIVVSPGTYRESVLITKSNLTLRGAGEQTVIRPAAVPAVNACAQKGNGICVTGTDAHPVERVTVRGLKLTGFTKNGVWATRTDELTVREVTAEKNGQWGIAEERSTRSVFRGNIARDNAESGLFVSNTVDTEAGATDTLGTEIRDNQLLGNRIGATIRRVRNLTVKDNIFSANCAGVFVVGDESLPRAGSMIIRGNTVSKNNKYCAATPRLPDMQGAGIVLTGTTDTLVESNVIQSNVGSTPFSGGVVLFKSFVGAVNERNVIRDNVLTGNTTADLAVRETGTHNNKFNGNVCTRSEPAGLC
ncbi:right-handed parallel beta-helix repeat-containing protein [Streptomyces sannanensis]|uniref:Right-handed parallel beta-helix repeat-containing protein n=1 Tax=Streptomyces sannanensis TaxID=285536 RepID=A0ABP6S3H5_9ACTN